MTVVKILTKIIYLYKKVSQNIGIQFEEETF